MKFCLQNNLHCNITKNVLTLVDNYIAMKVLFLIVTILLICHLSFPATRDSCVSPVYCQGELLDTVQKAGIFNDSKTFVDMAMINSLNDTLQNFKTFMAETDNEPNKEQIRNFVHQNFRTIGELEDVIPPDFKKEPKLVKEISDPVIRNFATRVIAIWPTLTREVSHHVFEHPDSYSIIPVPNRFIIPGGRFKEYYYWDSYWIVKGLLLSDMTDTAKGMIENLLSVVDHYGFMPNGGRVYYLNRSQPPVLALMVFDYVKYTNDYEFMGNNIHILEKELNFWLKKRVTGVVKDGKTYILGHYDSESDTPRPESYIEDIETCENITGDAKVSN